MNEISKIRLNKLPDRKLLVTNIPSTTTHMDVKEKFSRYGIIVDCMLKRKGAGEKSYAFVTYSTAENAMRARNAAYLRLICFQNQQVKVQPANAWHQPEDINVQKMLREIIITGGTNVVVHHDDGDVQMDEDGAEAEIHRLNDHCLMQIFKQLTVVDRVRIERVCKRWLAVGLESWYLCRSLDLFPSTWWPSQSMDTSNPQQPRLHDTPITTSILHRVLRRCGLFLARLDLASGGRLLVHGNSVLVALSQYCPNVQVVDLGSLEVTETGVRGFGRHCRKLRTLTLRLKYFGRAADDCLAKLFARNTELQSLDLCVTGNNSAFEGRCLMHLPKRSFQELTLAGETSGDLIAHLHKVVERLECLRSLRLYLVNQAPKGAAFLSFLPLRAETLKVLEIPQSKAYYYDVKPILELRHLEKLNIADCSLVDDNFVIELALRCEYITDLDISSCVHVGNRGLSQLHILPNLRRLRASHLPLITDMSLADLTGLLKLDCSACANLRCAGGLRRLLEARETQLELLDVSECGPRVCAEVLAIAKRVAEKRQKLLTIRACNAGIQMEEGVSRYLKVVTRNW